ncbi:wall-associated receptor kinase 4-like [Eucalyptus grandis]|uniref:wall-associated receptor kinase 4-like n=1 Tax=Eucalyptus grandis TaxID=71139 RepID=UPI00192EB25A|nr:wall-associated receptor kinase 4-like [Eucalyptus grandis]
MPSKCERRCGDVTIPYPFGLESNCARSTDFLLNCKNTEESGFRLMWGSLTIRNISVRASIMAASFPEAYECYYQNGTLANNSAIYLPLNPLYRLSDTQNELILLGCDAYAVLANSSGAFQSGCMTYCFDNFDVIKESVCSGQGCCQASIPKGLKTLHIRIISLEQNMLPSRLGRCVRAFVVNRRSFDISKFTLPRFKDVGNTPSVALDWMVESNMTCQKAKRNQSSYACGNNAKCRDFGLGYRCFCKDGYDGNPYGGRQGCTGN